MVYNIAFFGTLALLSTVDACSSGGGGSSDSDDPEEDQPFVGAGCHAILFDDDGHQKQFDIGTYRNLGDWSDRAVDIEVVGSENCIATGFESFDGKGSSYVYRGWSYSSVEHSISSLRVELAGRRRRADVTGEYFTTWDPLCEAAMSEGLLTGWSFAEDEATQAKEVQKLRGYCADEFSGEALDQCLFYLHAMTEVFESEELVEKLRFDAETETLADEYQRCGLLTNTLNKAIENGEVSGIEKVTKDGVDYFKMETFDERVAKHRLVQATAGSDGILRAVVSVGSVISTLIGAHLALVCKDFGADGRWLLE